MVSVSIGGDRGRVGPSADERTPRVQIVDHEGLQLWTSDGSADVRRFVIALASPLRWKVHHSERLVRASRIMALVPEDCSLRFDELVRSADFGTCLLASTSHALEVIPLIATPESEFTPERRTSIVVGLWGAIAGLHACGVTVGNLSPESFLTDTTGTLIWDLSRATMAGSKGLADYYAVDAVPDTYAAPGLDAGASPTQSDDVFSLGMISIGLLARPDAPVPTRGNLADWSIQSNLRDLALPDDAVAQVATLLNRTLQRARAHRPSAADVHREFEAITSTLPVKPTPKTRRATPADRLTARRARSREGQIRIRALKAADRVVWTLMVDRFGIAFQLREGEHWVGRSTSTVHVDIDVSPFDPARHVSRRHCRVIAASAGALRLRAERTKNPTHVNGRVIPPDTETVLVDGDKIDIAGLRLVVRRGTSRTSKDS